MTSIEAWRAMTPEERQAAIDVSNPYLAQIQKIRACSLRGEAVPDSGPCNCLRFCSKGPNPTSVTIQDCLACVTA